MNHAALEPAGPFAQQIAELFWFFVGVAAFVYVAVIGVLILALRRRSAAPEAPPSNFTPRTAIRAIGAALGVSA